MRVLILIAAALSIFSLTSFAGFWGPSSFEECRDEAAREAKTEAAMGVLIRSCREKFPKLSELKDEWTRFARAAKNHKYDPAISAKRAEPISIEKDFDGFFAAKYGGKHMTTEGRAELLISKEFMNWFVGQTGYIKSLLVLPMRQSNEDKIFEAYGRADGN
jgi:hypothetical protein